MVFSLFSLQMILMSNYFTSYQMHALRSPRNYFFLFFILNSVSRLFRKMEVLEGFLTFLSEGAGTCHAFIGICIVEILHYTSIFTHEFKTAACMQQRLLCHPMHGIDMGEEPFGALMVQFRADDQPMVAGCMRRMNNEFIF